MYIEASDSYWVVRDSPKIKNFTVYDTKEPRMQIVPLQTLADIDDQFKLSKGTSDCDPAEDVSGLEIHNTLSYLYFWNPNLNQNIHICWREKTSTGIYSSWERIEYSNGTPFELRVYIHKTKTENCFIEYIFYLC